MNSRYLDDKAGVAVLLGVVLEAMKQQIKLPVDCHLLFTISEEVGSGASSVLHGDVSEMVTIDAGPSAPGHNTDEFGVTICMKDSSGPFDYHLTHKLLRIADKHEIRHSRNVFKRARRPTNAQLTGLLDRLRQRIVAVLERRGLLVVNPHDPYLDFEAGSSLDQLQAASIHYRIAIGLHAGTVCEVYQRSKLEPPDFIAWLAALVPRPRLNPGSSLCRT